MPDRQTSHDRRSWLHRIRQLFWPAVVLVVFGLGVAGFRTATADRPLPWHVAVYRTLRLFTIDVAVAEGVSPPCFSSTFKI